MFHCQCSVKILLKRSLIWLLTVKYISPFSTSFSSSRYHHQSNQLERMKIIFAGSLRQDAVELAKHLLLHGYDIMTINAPETHKLFAEHDICHEESVDPESAIIDFCSFKLKCSVLIASLDEMNDKKSLNVQAMVRFAALHHESVPVVLEPYDFNWLKSIICGNKFIDLNDRALKHLACIALERVSLLDMKFARKLKYNDEDEDRVNVLVVGGGGREHSIAVALANSPSTTMIHCAPGNGGTCYGLNSKICNAGISATDKDKLVAYAIQNKIKLVFVGPEVPLMNGLSDSFANEGIPCFGPSAAASRLEGSKAFSKDFMIRHGIPTARYKNFTDSIEAKAYVDSLDYPVVVKASGLAAGKGVILPESKSEAFKAIDDIMVNREFGDAGNEIVIEELLLGEEVSILAFCDGITAICMPAAQDHKRALDGDKGLNTGGMGAYAPTPCLTPIISRKCSQICQKTIDAMAKEGMPFIGVLFAGFMLTKDGPIIIEFNVRMGDPETQVLLPLLQTDLYEVVLACVERRLKDMKIAFKAATAVTVVMAAKGYPKSYPKDMVIKGLDECRSIDGVTVYHAGTTASDDGIIKANGGRVLSVTGVDKDLKGALQKAYKAVNSITFTNSHYRKDIGHRALKAPVRIGVLGSGNGTAMGPVIEAINKRQINAKIVLVISNKENAPILERAKNAGLPSLHIAVNGRDRTLYDKQITSEFEDVGVDLILMVGYMRIVSDEFCQRWSKRCLNVHPSLLPDFAGGMDLAVHEAVIMENRKISGCTIHFVNEIVDGGEIVVQTEVSVVEGETPMSLKNKVQPLEGPAFIKAIQLFIDGKIGPNVAERVSLSYRSAGVDIDAGSALVERIKPACKSTIRPGCEADLGGFGGLFDLKAAGYDSNNTVLIGATDGVGTKLKIAQAVGDHSGVGIDLVAMCVNDLIVAGGEPLFFLDYYATGKLSVDEAATVVESIAEGCRQANCGLIGGETAELPSMYPPGEYDLAGFAVGAVNKDKVLPKEIEVGDVLLGLRSSGIHSNGFSLVRKILERECISYSDIADFDQYRRTFGQILLTPTTIYVKSVMPMLNAGVLKGLAHITGGGLYENIPRILPKHCSAHIDELWTLPPIFKWLKASGHLSQEELLTTFNCGIGMVLVVSSLNVAKTLQLLKDDGNVDDALMLGTIQARVNDEHQVVVAGELN